MKSMHLPTSVEHTQVLYDSRPVDDINPPEASLIIPVYNVAPYIEECLGGVLATASTVKLEIILIDDGSTDASRLIVADILKRHQPMRTVFLKQQNQGLSAVRNLGVSVAGGDFIGFLDSDDLISTGALRYMLDFARAHQCEVVLGRSLVFDSKNDSVASFYDDWVWRRLLAERPSRIVSRHEDPAIFMLEPNANYRLIRRDFFLKNGFLYPVGKLFEDPPVHYKMLAKAARIGLLDVPYYWYRVNRPGKITAERSQRRFDVLDVSREVFVTLNKMDITADEGGAILYGLCRIVWWCGTMTLPDQRRAYFDEACRVFKANAPPAWAERFRSLWFPDEILHLVLGALISGDVDALVRLSFGQRTPLKSVFFLIRIGRKDLVIRRLREMGANKLQKIRSLVG